MTLARGLDMSVTAEGVETAEEFERLTALGVNFAQGYLFGRPQPVDQIAVRRDRVSLRSATRPERAAQRGIRENRLTQTALDGR